MQLTPRLLQLTHAGLPRLSAPRPLFQRRRLGLMYVLAALGLCFASVVQLALGLGFATVVNFFIGIVTLLLGLLIQWASLPHRRRAAPLLLGGSVALTVLSAASLLLAIAQGTSLLPTLEALLLGALFGMTGLILFLTWVDDTWVDDTGEAVPSSEPQVAAQGTALADHPLVAELSENLHLAEQSSKAIWRYEAHECLHVHLPRTLELAQRLGMSQDDPEVREALAHIRQIATRHALPPERHKWQEQLAFLREKADGRGLSLRE